MDNKRGIFVSTISQVVVRIVGLAIALVSIKLLTRYLGTEGTGEFNTITTYVNFSIVLADLGLFSASVREISKNPDKERQILSNVLTLRIVTAAIAAIVAAGLVFLTGYGPSIKMGVVIAAAYIFLNLVASTYDVVLQYRLQMQYSALAELFSKIVAVIALYFVVRFNGGFLWTVSTITLSGAVILVTKNIFARRIIPFSPRFDRAIADWILHTSLPLGIVFIVNNLYFKIDTLILFGVKGAAAVGIYSVAYKVLEVTIFIGSYFGSSLKPELSKNIDKHPEKVAATINKAVQLMLFAALPITVISIVFSSQIILFLSTPEFLPGAYALAVLSATLPVIYCDILLGEVLVAMDARKLLFRISLFMFLFNAGLNIIFIPLYSYRGAAFTTLFSEIALLAVNYWYVRKMIPLRLNFLALGRILFVSFLTAGTGLALARVPFHFLIPLGLTGVAYLAFSYMFGIFRPQEIRDLLKG